MYRRPDVCKIHRTVRECGGGRLVEDGPLAKDSTNGDKSTRNGGIIKEPEEPTGGRPAAGIHTTGRLATAAQDKLLNASRLLGRPQNRC